MWRPVALSAFLALLFMSSRSGQAPVETNTNDLAKSDFGASASQEETDPPEIKIDLARSSAHSKSPPASAQAESSEDSGKDSGPAVVASVETTGNRTMPLPAPKADPAATNTTVVVTQGEQKTALTTDEQALALLPPGPDFAAKVQQELARLGCYRGRIDNIWGPMSRNAVARFNRVAKSKLPLRQPTRALLSSARQAPDGYCDGGGAAGTQVAALNPGAGLEELRNRPSYLPPWMRGEPMPEEPEPEEEPVVTQVEDTPEAPPQQNTAPRTRAEETERTVVRARQVERRRVQRRQARRAYRKRPSFTRNLAGWPGSLGR